MAAKRFIRRGVSKFYFLPSATDYKALLRTEIDAGADITDEIADLSGWMLENSPVPTPDMGSTFEKNIPGLDSAADSTMTFYEPEEVPEAPAVDVDTVFAKGTEGIVVIMRRGDKPDSPSMDAFPVRVASKGAEFSAGNDPARTVCTYSVTDEPALDQVIPAVVP